MKRREARGMTVSSLSSAETDPGSVTWALSWVWVREWVSAKILKVIGPRDVSPTAVFPWVISLGEEPHLDSVSGANFFSFFLCVHVCEGSGGWVYVYRCTWSPEFNLHVIYRSCFSFLFEAGSLTGLELIDPARLTSQSIPLASTFLAPGWEVHATMPVLIKVSTDTSMARALTTKLSPQPLHVTFWDSNLQWLFFWVNAEPPLTKSLPTPSGVDLFQLKEEEKSSVMQSSFALRYNVVLIKTWKT